MTKLKVALLSIGAIVALPFVTFAGWVAYIYLVSAFPSQAIAIEHFEEGGAFEYPSDATLLYFRMAVGSPMDRGGSAMRFVTSEAEVAKKLNTQPNGLEWSVLEQDFLCNCLQCLRYGEPVNVPAGSSYWKRDKGSTDYQLMAVNKKIKQVFWCEQDT